MRELLLGPDEAAAAIAAEVRPLAAEELAPRLCRGRVLAADVVAAGPLPAFDSAAMDGYAVRAADARGAAAARPVRLPKAGVLYAGDAGRELPAGRALRVMTGAPLPSGADAVVMQEHAGEDGAIVSVFREPAPGDHVRRRGEDVEPGSRLLEAGRRLRALDVALLCAQGVTRVPVVRRPLCGVLVTGDELVGAEKAPGPGQVRDAVGPAVEAALEGWGALAFGAGRGADELDSLARRCADALARCDALLVCGGVSFGERDFTRAALERAGARVVFAGVAVKPGKPLLFGAAGGKPVFGLPGNPVAALVCLDEFVRPAVEALQGRRAAPPSYHMSGRLAEGYVKRAGRRQYLFCRADRDAAGFLLHPIRPQGAHMLGMAARADSLAVAPMEASRLPAGTTLPFRWLK